METERKEYVKQEHDKVNSLVDTFTLFDDELMGRVFDKNVRATELVLRIVLGRNIKVISVNGQEEIRNSKVGGRNIILDVHAIDVNGSYRGDDAIGKLVSGFHQTDSEKMYYSELADGVEHYKETEKGRGNMSEAVEKYAREYAEEYAKECVVLEKITSVKNLMQNMKLTLEQALNALGIQGNMREQIVKQLSK